MFGSTNKSTLKKSVPSHSAVTILTAGCHFNGKLYCRGSTRIGGQLEGEMVSEGFLIIEESAMISANIVADEVIVQGYVKGKLTAKGRVELTATCRFEGDIETPVLSIQAGAQFNGQSHMVTSPQQANSVPTVSSLKEKTLRKEPDIKLARDDQPEPKRPEIAVREGQPAPI